MTRRSALPVDYVIPASQLASQVMQNASVKYKRDHARGVVYERVKARARRRYAAMREKRQAKQAESVGLRPRPATAMPWNKLYADSEMRLIVCPSVRAMLGNRAGTAKEEGA